MVPSRGFPHLLRLLVLLGALSACASPGGGDPTSPVPRDFHISLRSAGASNPHCDFEIEIDARGLVTYAVHHRGIRPSDRRGELSLSGEDLAFIGRSVEASGLFDLPAFLGPEEGQEERGTVVYEARSLGRRAAVTADRAGTAGLDAVLRAVYAAVPVRIWRTAEE